MRLRPLIGALVVSLAGVTAIKVHEGKRNGAYQDPAHGWGVPTICYGHTATARKGMWLSDGQCLDLLAADAQEHAGHVLRLAKVPLYQSELDAYTSFVFNVGPGNFAKSTALRRLNAGDAWGACMALLPWVNAGGKPYRGLIDRRYAEYNLCISELPFVVARR